MPPSSTRLPKDGGVRLADHSADLRMVLLGVMALAIGSGGAIAASALLKLIALVTNLAWFGRFSLAHARIADVASGPMVLFIPVAGSLIIGLMARFGSEKIRGHGIPEAIEAILFGQSRLSIKVAVLKPLSSAISIGSGGPFGAEGPIIMTGGAIGSLFAQCFHLSAAERKTLLVAGAAAGMTAIFGTPVAAILLAVEVLLFEWKPRSLVPVIAGALTALAWRPLLIGAGPLFPFAGHIAVAWWLLPAAAGLGVIGGLMASFVSSMLYRIEDLFHRLPLHWMWWPAIGAVVVGVGGLIDPRVLGAGYENIQDLLDGTLIGQALLLLIITKTVVWLVALGSGTSGGVLAPLLIIGGTLGAIVGHWLPGDAGFWALLGMAAVMSAAMRAPLTGAVFAIELTGRLDGAPRNHRCRSSELRRCRTDPATLDPDREDFSQGAPYRAGICGRPSGDDPGAGYHDRRSRDPAGCDADVRGCGILCLRSPASDLSGRQLGGAAGRIGVPLGRNALAGCRST